MENKLFNSKYLSKSLSITGYSKKNLKEMLSKMLYIRKIEQKIALERKNGLIGGPVHLGVGQEAIAVGISQNLKKTDCVFGAHRSHAHLLSLNLNFYKLFAEVLGKETGFSKGMGGSMHLFDQDNGFYGSTPIVAGTVPLAVGAALASKINKSNKIAVSYLGDGAVEEGVVHESFNLAKILNVPILFIIENNLFASHMHISLRQPKKSVSRFAIANNIPYKLLDGNNVISVAKQSKEIIKNIRSGKGPGVVELITYRWHGHVDWRDDIDVGVARSKKDVAAWKAKDPIKRLSQSMIRKKIWTKQKEKQISDKIEREINIAWNKAIKDPYPSLNSIKNYVYSNDRSGKK